jgi:prolyl oligopeptidase
VFQDESAVDTSQIETKRVDIPTRDGKRVPTFISMKKGTVLDGKQPVLLYGYGGFNIGMTTRYLGSWVPLINRGVIFVEAGLRGGDEFGEAWHQDGMLLKKQNTFNDFIDTAQWLLDNNYTNPQKLAIMGGSNGGLLVGAAATQRPDLFKAVVCSVPLLDMVRFHKFLIARYWITEYGDPEKAADFRNILSYSPYHAIRSGVELPAMMVIAGENDSRVDPLHAKKFVARAQANAGQTNPVLLKMDFDSGHGAGKSTQQLIDDREVWMRFILSQIGEK